MKLLRVFVASVVLWALLPLSGAAAQMDGRAGNERIVVSGPVVVAEDETVDDVLILRGSATIDGQVNGDVIVFDGPVNVSGTVNGNLLAFKGPVNLRDGAEITGDVAHGGPLNSAPGATIRGETNDADFREFPGQLRIFGRVAAWIGFTVSVLLIGLLMMLIGPRLTEALAETGLTRTAPALGWGLVAFLGIPILAIISFVTLVGIPLGFMLTFGMIFLLPVAYATSVFVLGRKLIGGPARRFVSFAAGLGVLRLLAMVPVLGGFTWFVATAFGLGVIALAVARTRATPLEAGPIPAAAAS